MNRMMVRCGLTRPTICAIALAALLVCASSGFAQTPELSNLLLTAQKTHPDILAATAKVQLAEAELEQARLKVAQEVIAFHQELKLQQAKIRTFEAGWAQDPDNKKVQQYLIDHKTLLAEIQAKMPFLFGQQVPGVAARQPQFMRRLSSYVGRASTGAELPKGPMLELLRERLGDPISAAFDDVQLSEILKLLAEDRGIPIVFDPGLEDAPITLHFGKPVALGAVLQAIEDLHFDLRFVIRGYGILATDEDSEVVRRSKSAVEFWAEECGKGGGGKKTDSDSTTPADSKGRASRTPR